MGIVRMKLFVKSKNKKNEHSEKNRRDYAAMEILRLSQGTPIIGYHNAEGDLVIPAEYDDGYDDGYKQH